MALTADAKANRRYWDGYADEYQTLHAEQLAAELVWGTFSVPERRLRVLGDVEEADILELGCGAAQWSIGLAKRGARPVGLDNSKRQLAHARRLQREHGVSFRLVHAPAEDVPLPDASFDIVFSDHGGMSYADPRRTVPEIARLLRPGGLLAFNRTTPIWDLCWNDEIARPDDTMHYDYFGLERWEDTNGHVDFQLPYGEWIRLFHAHGFVVEDLIELRPPRNATSTYWTRAELAWARRWPSEHIWKVRKRAQHP